ncbi:hypothetical protein [Streptococcus dysgalactiae]|uniref:hypothetical protein n=2 Tax=Streptococcus dysgalactiae TaxID=1334 RepID=UPI001D0134ED|nr:hypothetical protein [Streptococcus dysgalactiae]
MASIVGFIVWTRYLLKQEKKWVGQPMKVFMITYNEHKMILFNVKMTFILFFYKKLFILLKLFAIIKAYSTVQGYMREVYIMSKYKIAGLTAITTMFFITGGVVSADNVTLTAQGPTSHKVSEPCEAEFKGLTATFEGPTHRTSDPCLTEKEIPSVNEKNFINYAGPGGRGTEGSFSPEWHEKLAKIKLPYFFQFNNR